MLFGNSRNRKDKFTKTLDKVDFQLCGGGALATQTIIAGVYNRIGAYTVPAQQQFAFGYGSAAQSMNQGYLYVELIDAAVAAMPGNVRLVQENATGTRKIVVFEEREEVLHGALADRQLKVALPEQVQFPLIGEDSNLVIEYLPDAALALAADLDHDGSTVYIPVTVYQ